jgi:hypothetical protein
MNTNTTFGLTNDQLFKRAPSIFAESPAEDVSDKYQFIPTIQFVDKLREEGFVPVSARESGTRKEANNGFQKHIIRFRHESTGLRKLDVGEEIIEAVLINSHNRSSGFQLHNGVYRCVCSNQMVVSTNAIDRISVKHIGNHIDDVIEGSYEIIERAPAVLESINNMKHLTLNKDEQYALAESALEITESKAKPQQLLQPRRYEDVDQNIWSTFNVIQENILKGGILTGRSESGRRQRTRAIKAIDSDIRINRGLWVLAEKMRELKAA